jgi:uncharacterized protein (DUF488 family)
VSEPANRQVFSIGHSNHSLEKFLDLLQRHRIEILVDVRSQPHSCYAKQFNADALRDAMTAAGIKYLFLGRELGGRPEGEEFYDEEGRVRYDRLAELLLFQQGIERLKQDAGQHRVAMMCSEEDPAVCHRHLLIARVLAEHRIAVEHIRGDGTRETYQDVCGDRQGLLFGEEEEWKSIRSVLPRNRPPSSSDA